MKEHLGKRLRFNILQVFSVVKTIKVTDMIDLLAFFSKTMNDTKRFYSK
jgi:hypothetical protein